MASFDRVFGGNPLFGSTWTQKHGELSDQLCSVKPKPLLRFLTWFILQTFINPRAGKSLQSITDIGYLTNLYEHKLRFNLIFKKQSNMICLALNCNLCLICFFFMILVYSNVPLAQMHCDQYHHRSNYKQLWLSVHDQTIQNSLTVKGGASKVPHLWEDLMEVDGY